MAEWPIYTVHQLIELGVIERPMDGNHGSIHPKTADFVDSGIPFIMASDLTGGRVDLVNCAFISEKQAGQLAKGFSKPGDVLLSHKATLGRTAIVQENEFPYIMLTPQVTYYRIKNTRKLNNRFLKYYFNSRSFLDIFEAWAGGGSTRAYLGITAQRDLPIPMPPIEVQLAIAELIGPLDDKIELNRRMNETLEAMARAIFKDWFVDFGPTRAKMEGRAPYLAPDIWSLFPARLDDDGKPEGWTVTQLGELLTVLETGGRPKGGVSGYRSGVPSVGAESISRLGEFDFNKTKYVPEEFFVSMRKGHVQSRDVLLYKDGGKPGLFEPHVTLFGDGFPFQRFAINEHVYRMRVKEIFGQNWLYFWLSTDGTKAEMRIKGTGVAIPGLNSTQVRSLSVLVPSNGLAKRLDGILEPLVTRVLANCNESRSLATARDFLLPKLMSGEVRVQDAEKLVEEAT
ncbi:restriction endonuclease subunit S [Bosea sp. (in: a-proteobacteria)]|uniref:restriction endonuclease subunit S n=1 Tax=Bosea sp. (in: a-proteobacteria) TaxID=1871050 RepID=UPI003F70FA29